MKTRTSMRYGGGAFDARTAMIRVFGRLQRKKVVILDSDPRLCGEILAASDTKGTFLERLFAVPAWNPVYSIESMDGAAWEQLSRDFKKLMAQLDWRERLTPLIRKHTRPLVQAAAKKPGRALDAEAISRLVARVLFELLFEEEMTSRDSALYYRASLEWRKEIAVKGKADPRVKSEFWKSLERQVARSRFKDGLASYEADPACWLSLFAQPFLISPQINISDIFVAIFDALRASPGRLEQARGWARSGDKPRLEGIVLESIRLRHPFPILERELKKDLRTPSAHYEAGTHFFILLDRFKQDMDFDPERWLLAPADNPYASIPFAAGPRMCVGKPIAMELLGELLKIFLLEFPEQKIQPARGHLYSGRNNDGPASSAESRYQLRAFSRALWQSFRLGRRSAKAIEAEATGCPWKWATGRFKETQEQESKTWGL